MARLSSLQSLQFRDDAAASGRLIDVFSEQWNTTKGTRAWMVILIIIIVLLLALASVFVASSMHRKRGFRQISDHDSFLNRIFVRKRRAHANRYIYEERQRNAMIHKSLAAKNNDAGSTAGILNDEDEKASLGLKEDWKAWEARIRRHESRSAERHPSWSAESVAQHPTLPPPSYMRPLSQSPVLTALPVLMFPGTPSLKNIDRYFKI